LIARKLAWSSFHVCAVATTVAVADDIIPAGTELERVAKAPIAANVAAMARIKRPRHLDRLATDADVEKAPPGPSRWRRFTEPLGLPSISHDDADHHRRLRPLSDIHPPVTAAGWGVDTSTSTMSTLH
jgi:hypothetical protein